jgi:hypothetical protein
MRGRTVLAALGLMALLTGCDSSGGHQWMKLDEKYTTEDFRRDYRECSSSGAVDESCMRSRGWVTVSTAKGEKAPEPQRVNPVLPRAKY